MPIQIDFFVGEFCEMVRDIVAFCIRFYLKKLVFKKKLLGFSFDLMVGGALILHLFAILKVNCGVFKSMFMELNTSEEKCGSSGAAFTFSFDKI